MKRLRNSCVNWFKGVTDGWNRFWFQPADPTTLGLIRLLVGGMLLYSHLVWGLELELLLGPDGWHSEDAVQSLQRDQYAWSFWWLVPAGAMALVHWICFAFLVCFFLGLYTPVTGLCAFVISTSYMYRAPMANYGLDQFLSCLVFYLALCPCGKTWSLDWLVARYQAAARALRGGSAPAPFHTAPSVRANLFQRLIQVQLCIVYFFAGTAKLQGTSWWTGMAMWQAFSNLEYQSFDMTWLAFYPMVINLISHTTIVWELAFPFLVWNRHTRPLILLMGVLMHLGIGALMGMWTFGLIMIFGYLAFCPGESLRRLLSRCSFPFLSRTQVVFQTNDPLGIRQAAWYCAWDFHQTVQFVPSDRSDRQTQTAPIPTRPANANARPGMSLADMEVGGLVNPSASS